MTKNTIWCRPDSVWYVMVFSRSRDVSKKFDTIHRYSWILALSFWLLDAMNSEKSCHFQNCSVFLESKIWFMGTCISFIVLGRLSALKSKRSIIYGDIHFPLAKWKSYETKRIFKNLKFPFLVFDDMEKFCLVEKCKNSNQNIEHEVSQHKRIIGHRGNCGGGEIS